MATTTRTVEVLVVDDEPMVREVVARYLTIDGMSVHEVGHGDDALAWLADHQPDLVVLDLMLPGSDGLTILRHLRAIGDIPVILLTARAKRSIASSASNSVPTTTSVSRSAA